MSPRHRALERTGGMRELLDALRSFDTERLFKEKTDNTMLQFFRYIFVGAAAFAADAGALWAAQKLMHYLAAAAIAFMAGLAVNYTLSKYFVFSDKSKNPAAEFTAYGIIGVIGLGITELLMYIFTDICGIYFLASKVIAAAVVLIWNFAARKALLYRKD